MPPRPTFSDLLQPGVARRFAEWLWTWAGYDRGPKLMSRLAAALGDPASPPGRHPLRRDVYLGPRFSLFIPENGTFHVGDGVEFQRDFRAEVSGQGRITIGSGTRFTYSVGSRMTR